MKQSCPKCKTLIEINEKEYAAGSTVVKVCPLCDGEVTFNIPKSEMVDTEEYAKMKNQLELLKREVLALMAEREVYVGRMIDGRHVLYITDCVCDGFQSLINFEGETIGRRGGIAGMVKGDWNVDWNSMILICKISPDGVQNNEEELAEEETGPEADKEDVDNENNMNIEKNDMRDTTPTDSAAYNIKTDSEPNIISEKQESNEEKRILFEEELRQEKLNSNITITTSIIMFVSYILVNESKTELLTHISYITLLLSGIVLFVSKMVLKKGRILDYVLFLCAFLFAFETQVDANTLNLIHLPWSHSLIIKISPAFMCLLVFSLPCLKVWLGGVSNSDDKKNGLWSNDIPNEKKSILVISAAFLLDFLLIVSGVLIPDRNLFLLILQIILFILAFLLFLFLWGCYKEWSGDW